MPEDYMQTPIEEIRTGRGDYGSYNTLFEYLEFEAGEINGDKDALLKKVQDANSALDLGCGEGYSMKAIEERSPHIGKIVGVDATTEPNPTVIEGLPVQTVRSYINDFLKNNTDHFDIALISHAPDHGIDNEGYKKLADAIDDDGLVIETGQTMLDDNKMEEYFVKAFIPKKSQLIGTRDVIWQKRS